MQVNKIETQKKLKMLDIQAEMLKTSKKKYEITDKEVSNLAPDTRLIKFPNQWENLFVTKQFFAEFTLQ